MNELKELETELAPRKKASRKDRVKNIAIVFLAVLLVFTFFSNTIMNRSLPEVSGQYAGSGTISTSIRGTGTVTANMAYSVQIENTRQIRAVYVKSGDTVEAGQVLFALEDADSQELKDARQALRTAQQELQTMQYNYSVKLLENLPADYTGSNQEIANLQADLAAAIADRAAVAGSGARVDSAKLSVRGAEDLVDQANDRITAIDDEITRLNGEIAAIQEGEIENYPDLVAAAENLRLAQTAHNLAQAAYDRASQAVTALESGNTGEATQAQLTEQQRRLEDLQAELAQLQEDYQQLQHTYQAAQATVNSFGSTNSDYARAVAERDSAAAARDAATPVTEAELTAAERNVESLQTTYNRDIQDRDAAYSAMLAAQQALNTADEASLAAAQAAYDQASSAYLSAQRTAEDARAQYDYAAEDLNVMQANYRTYQTLLAQVEAAEAALARYESANTELAAAQAALDQLGDVPAQLLAAQRQIEQKQTEIQRQQEDLAVLQQQSLAAVVQDLSLQEAKDQQAAAKNNLDNAEAAMNADQTAYDNAVSRQVRALQSQVSAQQSLRTSANQALRTAQRALEDAQEAYSDLQADAALEESLGDTITSLQRSLSTAIATQASQQQQDDVSGQITDLELEQDQLNMQRQEAAIQEQEAVVAELEAANTDTAVTARYAGVITTVAVVAGDTAAPGQELAAIDVEGKGYTLTISVTAEQSRQVHVGDHATVSNYWWGDLDVELTAIKPDPSNPGQSRLLEFTVTGDVSEGQSLELSIGERQTRYDLVVPNSAIREDSNGTFILVATSKSTPLATRYTATRVNVTVIAKDSYNTAIDAGSDYGYEYVITTSTKPLEAGSQIRLVNN